MNKDLEIAADTIRSAGSREVLQAVLDVLKLDVQHFDPSGDVAVCDNTAEYGWRWLSEDELIAVAAHIRAENDQKTAALVEG